MIQTPPRSRALQKLLHLFRNSQNQVSIYYHLEIADLLGESIKQAEMFRHSPSNYLQGLLVFLKEKLAKEVESEGNEKKQNLEAKRRYQCTYIFMNSIPYTKKIYKSFSEINSEHIGSWVVLTGTVIQSTERKTLQKIKQFQCSSCQKIYSQRNSFQNHYNFELPAICTNLIQKQKANSLFAQLYRNFNKKKPAKEQKEEPSLKVQKCGGKKFKPVKEKQGKICIDYHELRIQEQFKFVSSGKIPQTIPVIIEGDITESTMFRPGDDITVTGILSYRFKPLKTDFKIFPQMVLFANNVITQKSQINSQKQEREQSQNSETGMSKIYSNFPLNYYNDYNLTSKERIIIKQLEFRRQIVESFCPSIYGRDMIKLGLILSLLGGVSMENQSSKIRGNSHVLLIGEPGTGKSVLLKEVVKLAERSFFTNGIGTTSAGLSVSYVREGKGEFMIEAGALVLADNGVCCIDQLTLLSKKDEKTLLECMEQQTISSAKASVMGKFNARTTVIGACNPIRPSQKYDPQVDLESNTGLMVPLLTRFDMIFILKDERDASEDSDKCDHILSKFCMDNLQTLIDKKESRKKEKINLKILLKKCKTYSPELSIHEILTTYYTEQRKREQKVKTARAFESLCRIAEAHAKLMLREKTVLLDYVTAICLTENNYFSTIEEYYAYLDDFNKKYGTNLS